MIRRVLAVLVVLFGHLTVQAQIRPKGWYVLAWDNNSVTMLHGDLEYVAKCTRANYSLSQVRQDELGLTMSKADLESLVQEYSKPGKDCGIPVDYVGMEVPDSLPTEFDKTTPGTHVTAWKDQGTGFNFWYRDRLGLKVEFYTITEVHPPAKGGKESRK